MKAKIVNMQTQNDTNQSIQETIISNLTQQLSEFELLQSMYPDRDEMVLNNKNVIKQINHFIEGKTDFTPDHLDFTIYLRKNNVKLEVFINFPTFYPETEEPDVHVCCNQMNRQQESVLNRNLSDFITENHQGDVCIYTILSWLQENFHNLDFNTEIRDSEESKDNQQDGDKADDKFVRYWIHSHHIYSKKKRDEILSRARQMNFTGFCLPGKPGVICIEGPESLCNEWWKDIKSMNWKKIVLRKTELFPECDTDMERKFHSFDEIQFPNPSSKLSKHPNMTEFFKYIEDHDLTHAFNDFFGLGDK